MYDDNVAKKIALQYKEKPITDFGSINTTTPLEEFNLNWREGDLPEATRTKHVHRLHPYMGKFIPQLVEIFLRKYKPKLVYDPFCGSGTTLVEANALGIDSVGTDISIFNTLLSKVKTAKYDFQLLETETNDILRRLYEYKINLEFRRKMDRKLWVNNRYLNTWFAKNARQELLFFLHSIKGYKHQDLFKIILSRSARSARLVTHYDLDFPKEPQVNSYYCLKHGRTCKPVEEAYKFIVNYAVDTLERIKDYSLIRTDAKIVINHEDSRTVKLPGGIDMIFTSPPYVGLIDYHEQHKYAYELLGLTNNEKREIGSAKKGQSEIAREKYITAVNDVILHTKKYMTKDALVVIVVNDKNGLYKAENVGFEMIGRVDRHVNRRTGRRNGAFYESILIWRRNDK